MTNLSEVTKAARVRDAFGKLAAEYVSEGKSKQASKVVAAAALLEECGPVSAVRLYDLLVQD